jgi:acetyl-CoA carboxylase carboxyltransferase component
MCSKELRSDVYLAWPSGEIAVMGAEEASNIIYQKEIEAAAEPEALRREKIDEYERDFSNPYAAARRAYIDRVIDPIHSRGEIIKAFDALRKKKQTLPWKKHSNIPL